VRTLRVLGGLWLDDGVGPSSGRGAQRRRLALLTLLALSRGRRVTRDKAIATLWPENTSAQGRRRLSSAVYDLRNLLGDDAIESAGDELWIASTAALRVDVGEFETAFARGDSEAALAAYGGPLLDGVHLSGGGAAEFEEWIASQRDRLRRQYLQALEQATAERLSRGDSRGAVTTALQLLDLEPLSGNAALVAVNTLVAAGDRPRALAVADAHAARVRRELGVDPDNAILEATRRLRATNGHRLTDPVESRVSDNVTTDASTSSNAAFPETTAPARQTRRAASALMRFTVAAAIVVAALAGAAFRSRASAAKHESPGSVGLTGIVAAASHSTTSSVALRAFIDGENAYASGRFGAAAKAFRAVVAQDSTFALAHYRLSESMLWQEEPVQFAAAHDSLALRWSSNLPDADQLLIRAYIAWRSGHFEAADTLAHAAIRKDPTNADALFQLGEVLFHYNPLRGRSIGEAGAWFDRALAVDSVNWGARWHLLLLDATRLSAAEFHDRVTQLLVAQPDGQLAAELRLFSADGSELPRLAATSTSAMLFDAAWRRAVFRRDLSGAETLLVRMTDRSHSEFDRIYGSFAIAALRFGQGHSAAAISYLDIDGAKRAIAGDAWIIRVHGLIANHADAQLDTLGPAIERWRQTLAGFDQPTSTPRIIARYLAGLLAVSRGDSAGALAAAADLDNLGRRHDPWVPADFRRPSELAQTVRAYREFRRGRCDAALRILDEVKGSYWLGVIASSPLASQSLEHYMRGECLLSLGRYADAARWFATLEQGTLYDLEFLGASLRGQAAAYRASGDLEAVKDIERRLRVVQGK
jgi:DNA-binding SARP family transcriptional activator